MIEPPHNRRLFLKTEAAGFSFAMRPSPHSAGLSLLGLLFDVKFQDRVALDGWLVVRYHQHNETTDFFGNAGTVRRPFSLLGMRETFLGARNQLRRLTD
jgi:hypothetical protein